MLSLVELRSSVVFRIQKDDINAQFRLLLVDQPGDFQQSSHSACSVIGSQNRGMVILFVSIIIRPRTGIPMCKQRYSLLTFRLVRADDVPRLQQCAVIGNQIGILIRYLRTESLQLSGQIIATSYVLLRIGDTGTKIYLILYIQIGTVRIKLRYIYHHFFTLFIRTSCLAASSTRKSR